MVVGNDTFAESAAPRCPAPRTQSRYPPAREHDPSANNNIPNRTTVAAPDGKQPSRRLSLRRPSSPGFPKGPQPLGTLTLPARSSVLYLRARDRRIRPAALRFSLLPGAKGYRAPLSSPPSDTAILYARILLVAFPRSVSNQFHNAWHLQPFPNDCKCFFYAFLPARRVPVHPAQ